MVNFDDLRAGCMVRLADGRIGILSVLPELTVVLQDGQSMPARDALVAKMVTVGDMNALFDTVDDVPDFPAAMSETDLVGIHFNAVSYGLTNDIVLAQRLGATWVMIMGGTDANFVGRIVSELPNSRVVARLWWHPGHGDVRTIIPIWLEQLRALYAVGVRWFAVGNEPNIGGRNGEGLLTHWRDGLEFGRLCVEFANLAQREYRDIVLVTAGLSPNPDLTTADGTIVADEKRFFTGMVQAGVTQVFDMIGVHAYWQNAGQMFGAVDNLSWYNQFEMPILVTEYANTGATDDFEIGKQYRTFLRTLLERNRYVRGTMSFVSTALRGQWDSQQWYVMDGNVMRRVLDGFMS